MLKYEPKEVWRFFEEISAIPRCSGNEERIRDYVLGVGEKNGLVSEVDEAGNVLLSETYDAGGVNLVLQAHMDMVCEKNASVDHDFSSDPIELAEEDGWVTARGTTLGADNGIGVAIALALAAGDYGSGTIDYLFTVDEERGLNGARNLPADFVRGDKLINLDSEEFGSFTIGCAGGGKTEIALPVDRIENGAASVVVLNISGLSGGHSGEDIDRGRANANKLLARLLDGLREEFDFKLVEVRGGDKHNAIPREATAVLISEGEYERIEEVARERFDVFRKEFRKTEPEMNLDVGEVSHSGIDRAISEEAGGRLINLLLALPNGVMAYDRRFEDAVETSTNLASVRTTGELFKILVSSRSSRSSRLENLMRRIELIAHSYGGDVEHNEAYPAWQPDRESELLARAEETFEELTGNSPEVKVIHGGLETGIIGEKVEGLQMLAMGPTIEFPHSPDERVEIESTRKFWSFLLELIEDIG
ncbi:MAG: beta-Ala-His dipeptidase [Candidatus Bipolaricaulota bacterium]